MKKKQQFPKSIIDLGKKQTLREKIIIEFHAKWCKGSRIVDRIINRLYPAYGKDLVFYKVDINENMDCIKKFGINKVPTLLYYNNSKEIKRLQGDFNIEKLVNFLTYAYKN